MAKTNGSEPRIVITLRIGVSAKKKLHAYCLARARAEGKRVSYNQAILEMIENSRASKVAKTATR